MRAQRLLVPVECRLKGGSVELRSRWAEVRRQTARSLDVVVIVDGGRGKMVAPADRCEVRSVEHPQTSVALSESHNAGSPPRITWMLRPRYL